MKYSALLISIIFCASNANAFLFSDSVTEKRISKTLEGSVLYLESTQIKERPGNGDCRYDSSAGDGCHGSTKNISGEWFNYLNPLALTTATQTETDSKVIADSNMFVTAAILYPLYWVEDQDGRLDKMRKDALSSIETYKRGSAYNFWPQFTNPRSGDTIVGPINFNVNGRDLSYPGLTSFASKVIGLLIPWVETWMDVLLDVDKNPDGFASFVNVPNDADDTSMVMALKTIQSKKDGTYASMNKGPLKLITQFRDENRSKHDERDTFTPQNTGAYLTWLKDENLPIFGDYKTGVMPLGVNNVDCVVNANVAFALSLNEMKDAPGYHESLKYLAGITKSSQWLNACGFYYPQIYTFAYAMTRAYRDGGARSAELDIAMDVLMKDLLKKQRSTGKWCASPDMTCNYATAMAVVSLINLGEERAQRLNIAEQYYEAIELGIGTLFRDKRDYVLLKQDKYKKGYTWKPGLFFSADDHRLGVWRSSALTNAIVIEALAKYSMDYQKSDKGLLEWDKRYKLAKKDKPKKSEDGSKYWELNERPER